MDHLCSPSTGPDVPKGSAMNRLAVVLAVTLATAAVAEEPATPLTAAPPSALSAGPDGGWSLLARVGTYVPVMGTFNAYRPGLALEAGLGRRLGAGLSLELSGLYVKARTTLPLQATVPLGTGTTSLSELTMAGGLATLRATLASGPLEVYAGAGLGWYWVQQYERVEGATFSGGFLSHDDALGAHAAAGAQVRVTPGLHLSLDLRYTYVEPLLFGRHERADGIGIAAGMGYRF